MRCKEWIHPEYGNEINNQLNKKPEQLFRFFISISYYRLLFFFFLPAFLHNSVETIHHVHLQSVSLIHRLWHYLQLMLLFGIAFTNFSSAAFAL